MTKKFSSLRKGMSEEAQAEVAGQVSPRYFTPLSSRRPSSSAG